MVGEIWPYRSFIVWQDKSIMNPMVSFLILVIFYFFCELSQCCKKSHQFVEKAQWLSWLKYPVGWKQVKNTSLILCHFIHTKTYMFTPWMIVNHWHERREPHFLTLFINPIKTVRAWLGKSRNNSVGGVARKK